MLLNVNQNNKLQIETNNKLKKISELNKLLEENLNLFIVDYTKLLNKHFKMDFHAPSEYRFVLNGTKTRWQMQVHNHMANETGGGTGCDSR